VTQGFRGAAQHTFLLCNGQYAIADTTPTRPLRPQPCRGVGNPVSCSVATRTPIPRLPPTLLCGRGALSGGGDRRSAGREPQLTTARRLPVTTPWRSPLDHYSESGRDRCESLTATFRSWGAGGPTGSQGSYLPGLGPSHAIYADPRYRSILHDAHGRGDLAPALRCGQCVGEEGAQGGL